MINTVISLIMWFTWPPHDHQYEQHSAANETFIKLKERLPDENTGATKVKQTFVNKLINK